MAKTATKPSKQESKEAKGNSLVSKNTIVNVTIPWKKAEPAYKKALGRLSKLIKIDGFRKGEVPAKIAEEELGEGQIIQKALEELINPYYQEAIKKSGKTPITHPEFNPIALELGKDWELEAHFAELPEVKLGKYKNIAKKAIKEAKKQMETDKKAKKEGDSKDKKEKEVKLTADQEKEIKLQHVFKSLATELKPKVPEMMLKHETQHEFKHLSQQLEQLKMTVDDYLQRRKMTMEQLSNELAVSTLGRIQLDLILGAISKEEKLSVTAEDRKKHFATIKDEGTRKKMENDSHYLTHLDTNLVKQKVVDFLLALN